VLTLAYFLHLVLPPVLALVLYRRDPRRFREFLLAVLTIGILGSIGYALVPAVGPAMAFPELFRNPLTSTLHGPITTVMDAARAPRDAFPSLHVGVSTLVLWYGGRLSKRWLSLLALLVVANWISTIYLRYHYLIDVFAGWLAAAIAVWLAAQLLNVEERIKA
jgi:membrane-associated phospholipid phosphatase